DPEIVRGPEVRVERCRVELVAHEGRVHETVDVRGSEPGIRERALHGFRGDLLRRPSRRASVRRLPDADDGDLPSDVLEGCRAAPVGVGHGRNPSARVAPRSRVRRAAAQCLIAVGGAGSRERMPSAFCCEVLAWWCAAEYCSKVAARWPSGVCVYAARGAAAMPRSEFKKVRRIRCWRSSGPCCCCCCCWSAPACWLFIADWRAPSSWALFPRPPPRPCSDRPPRASCRRACS